MSRCEDFPCCGHDICPDYDENGNQLNMYCYCGAEVSIDSRYSICHACMHEANQEWEVWDDEREDEDEDYVEDEYDLYR